MLDLEKIRDQFPAFQRELNGSPVMYFDGPAGSQVPQSVIAAVSNYLANTNANCGAAHATSQLSDQMLNEARLACADFLNASSAQEIVFGPNMTTMTLALSRALGRTWFVGDEIIVSNLDHDANVTPWLLAAEEAGAVVKRIEVNLDDCTLNMEQYRSLLSNRTKLVAVGGASNATGTVNPVKEIVRLAKSVGALTFVDAVHLAPHRLIDVIEIGCDFLACSAYKFFGPHVGILWGKFDLLEHLQPDKLRPSPKATPGKWMTGTQNHEGIAGLLAAIEYLADLAGGATFLTRRNRLEQSFNQLIKHEKKIGTALLDGLMQIPSLKIWGITNPAQLDQRVATISVTHQTKTPLELSVLLAERGLFTWAGNHYALPFTVSAELEPHGTLRIGLLHYNTAEEVERLLKVLHEIC